MTFLSSKSGKKDGATQHWLSRYAGFVSTALGIIAALVKCIGDAAGWNWVANLIPWIAVLILIAPFPVMLLAKFVRTRPDRERRLKSMRDEVEFYRNLDPRALDRHRGYSQAMTRDAKFLCITAEELSSYTNMPVHVAQYFLDHPTETPHDELILLIEVRSPFFASGFFTRGGDSSFGITEAKHRLRRYELLHQALVETLARAIDTTLTEGQRNFEIVERIEIALCIDQPPVTTEGAS